MAINPTYRLDWFLENILVIGIYTFLIKTYASHRLSNTSYTLIFIFSIFHTIGAHYTYSEVPFTAILTEEFGLERNYYDRFVHFIFGLLVSLPLRNLLERFSGLNGKWLNVLTVTAMISFGEVYEIIEWLTAIVVSPEAGVAFLGAQGDVFDAQKDVMCNLSGIFIAFIFQFFINKKSH